MTTNTPVTFPIAEELRWDVTWNNDAPLFGLPQARQRRFVVCRGGDTISGNYNHHPHIRMHEGALYLSWSTHAQDEDAPGQHVLVSCSTDGGESWSEPQVAISAIDEMSPASEDGPGRRTLCANGLIVVDDCVYAIAEAWKNGGCYRGPDQGMGRIACAVYPDGRRGEPFWLCNHPFPPLEGFPVLSAANKPPFFYLAQQINHALAQPENTPSWDFCRHVEKIKADDGNGMTEPSAGWQLQDGTWVRFYRDLTRSGWNYASCLLPGADAWSVPTRTVFPDMGSRTAVTQVPGGATLVVNNIRGGTSNGSPAREPLVLSIADNGLAFDRAFVIASDTPLLRSPGRNKDLGFSYPAIAVEDDSIWVVYSVNKEDIHCVRIEISELI